MRRLLLALAFVAIAHPVAAQAVVNGKNPQFPADLGPNGGLKVECIAGTCTGSGGAAPDVNISAVGGNVVTTTLPVSGTFWQMTQPVSGTFWQVTQPVSGTFWQVTQPVSGTVTANAGTNLNTSALALSATQTDRTQKSQITDGTRDGTVKAASTLPLSTDTALVVTTRDTVTEQPAGAATGLNIWTSATAVNTAVTVSVTNAASVRLGLEGDSTGGTLVFEESFDTVNWYPLYGWADHNAFAAQVALPLVSGQFLWTFNTAGLAFIRIRLSVVITSGTLYIDPHTSAAQGLIPVVAGGGKGATVPAVLTSTAEGADHQAIDAQLYHGGAAIDPRVLQAGTSAIGRETGTLSAGNSSTTNLGIGATFTGTFEDVKDYAAITVSVFADVASATDGLNFDWSHDGSNQDLTTGSSVTASSGRGFSITPRARYFRVRYINGGTGQATFRLGTIYHPTGSGLISRPLDQTLDTENYAQQVRAVADGFDGTNFVHIASATADVSGSEIGLVTRNETPALTKGTQGAKGYSSQDLKDAGRTAKSFYANNVAAGTTGTETLITLTQSSGTGATSSASTYTITNGKTFRIQALSVGSRGHATATIQSTIFNVRLNTGGACLVGSTPILFGAQSATPATASAWDRVIVPIPDGYEIAGNGTIAICISAAATYTTNAPTWSVNLVAYEY